MDEYATKSHMSGDGLPSSVDGKLEGLTTSEYNSDIKFVTAKDSEVQGLQAIFGNTRVPHITIDDNNTDTESHSRRSSISSSPAQLSPLSSIPNTPQLSHVYLQDGDILTREESLAGLKVDLYGCHVDDDIANPVGDCQKLLLIGSPRQRSDLSVSLSEGFNTKDLSAHEPDIATQSQEFRPTTSVTTEHDNREANFQNRLFSILRRIPGHPERKGFFPQHTFTALVDEQTVANELHRCRNGFDPGTIRALSQKICGPRSFRKIFTLLVLTYNLSDIQLFIDDNVTDEDLPLRKVPHEGSNTFQLARRGDVDRPAQPLRCFDEWCALAIRIFEEWQWTMLAPFLDLGKQKNARHFIFPDQILLPFTEDSRYAADAKAIQGGFGTIFKVNIHSEHYNFHGSGTYGQSFAVKRLKSYDRAHFKQEVDMLMTFSGNAHPHLISLLATYEQFDRFYMIFPWAEADLQGYWEEMNPNPSMDRDTVLWVAEQCRGIAQGLSKIHRHQTINFSRLPLEDYERIGKVSEDWVQFPAGQSLLWQLQLFGKHGDIKPQNVLWYRDPYNEADKGILKITDFGLAEFKTSARNIYKLANRVTVSAPYRPPERDIEDGSIGQSHDIWALGCLYLELVTWLLGGWDLVQEFQSQRSAKDSTTYHRRVDDGTFFEIKRVDEDGSVVAIVKPAVTKFIEDLHANPACTRYIHMLLDLIQTDMLIIKPSSPQEKGRMGIMEVYRILNDLWRDCSDIDFATKPMSQGS